jgi:pimeloyl-ACP methyl ester carboxylesterase
MKTKRFENDGGPALVYDDYGDDSSPPVVLLHGGAAGTRRYWLDIPDRLARSYRVLAPDMRGHGDSERAGRDYTIAHYAGDIEAFIDQVAGGKAALVGHCLGGLVAAQVAGTRPDLVDCVLFEDPPLHWNPGNHPAASASRRFSAMEFRAKARALVTGQPSPAAELLAAVVAESVETTEFFRPMQELFRALRANGSSVEDIVTVLREGGMPLAHVLDGPTMRVAVEGFLAFDPNIFETGRNALAAYDSKRPIACPMLVLRADPSSPPPTAGFPPEFEEAFLDTHPRATVELVEGAGHNIHLEKPGFFGDRLETLLAGGHA